MIAVAERPISIERAATAAVVSAAKIGSLLIIGEAGAGKSAVVSAAATALRAAGADVIHFAVDQLPVDTVDAIRAEIGLTHRVVGAAGGAHLGKLVDGRHLLTLFGVLMIVIGLMIEKPTRSSSSPPRTRLSQRCCRPKLIRVALYDRS